MAIIKAYTGIEQSKKLAEILGTDSADMYYDLEDSNIPNFIYGSHSDFRCYTMCWSLAALISIIPQEIFNGEYIINITEGWDNKWILTYDHHENRNHSYYSLSIGADNLVDACVAMIERLHKYKMLQL